MKNPVLSFRNSINRVDGAIDKFNESVVQYVKLAPKGDVGKQINEETGNREPILPPSAWGIDYRTNPLFLRVAQFFGVDAKEYPLAVNKLSEILDWAVAKTNSAKASDVLLKIAETSRGLESAGYQEKPYAILYRYIKFASDGENLGRSAKQLQQQQQDVQNEMKAYKT